MITSDIVEMYSDIVIPATNPHPDILIISELNSIIELIALQIRPDL